MMSSIADIVTIIAFLFTCFTAWKVFFINRDVQNMSNRYLLRKRLPEILNGLDGICKELALPNIAHVTEENAIQVRCLVAKCHGLCENLKLRLEGQNDIQLSALDDTVQICRTIKDERHNPGEIRVSHDSICLSGSDIRKLYGELSHLIQNIEDTMKDMESMIS